MSYYGQIRFNHMKHTLRPVSACSYVFLLYNESPIRLTDVLIRNVIRIKMFCYTPVMNQKLGHKIKVKYNNNESWLIS